MNPKELELRPTKHVVTLDESPKSMTDETITTASTTPASSPEADTSDIIVTENPLHQSRAVNLLESFNEAAIPQNNSIADRIRPTFEIHLSPEEEITHCIIHDINWSFITPIGLQQYDYELKKITVVLSIDELQNLGLGEFIEEARNLRFDEEAHLSYDELVDAKKKTNINDRLSIEQWRNLEIALIKSPYGRTVIGYSINEEVYLKFWGHVFQLYYKPLKNLGYPSRDYQYPPRKDDTEKLMLEFFQKKIIKDIRIASQIAGYTNWCSQLLVYYLYSFFEKNNSLSYADIYYKFINYLLIFSVSLMFSSFLILQLPILEHKFVSNILQKYCNVLHKFVGNIYRLYNYSILLVPNMSIDTTINLMIYSGPILIITSLYFGLKEQKKSHHNDYININSFSYLKHFYHAFSWTSFNQNLLSVGSSFLTNIPFYFNNDDQAAQEYISIMNAFFWLDFSILFSAQILLNPFNSPNIKLIGQYISNISNGITYSIFDAWIFFNSIYMPLSFIMFRNLTPSKTDYLNNSCYFIILILTNILAFHSSFINENSVSNYSIRRLNFTDKNCLKSKFLNFFNRRNNENMQQESTITNHNS